MSALDDFRMKNPGAASLSDAELIGRISGATGIDPGTVAADFGVQINDPGFVSTLKRSGAQMVGGVGEIYGDVTGNRNNAASRWAEDVAFRNPSGINSLADVAENPWLAAKEAVGNAATFLVPGAGLKIAGNVARGAKMLNTARALDNPLTQAAVAGLPSLSEIGESQRESGLPENYAMKYLGAGAVGAIENLGGVQRMMGLGRAPQVLSKADEVAQFGATPWRTAGKTMLRSGVEEGLEEIPQTFIEKGAGYQDPFSAKNLEEAALGGVMGAIGGGVLGAGHGAARGLRHAQVNRERSLDLLNPETPLGRLNDQAEWERAFIAKERGQAAADMYYNGQQGTIDNYIEGLVEPYRRQVFSDEMNAIQQRADQERIAARAPSQLQVPGYDPRDAMVENMVERGPIREQQQWWENVPDPTNPTAYQQFWQHVTAGQDSMRPQPVDALGYPLAQYQPAPAVQTQPTAPSWAQFGVEPSPVPQGTPSATQTQPVAAQAAATTQQKAQPKPAAAPAAKVTQPRGQFSQAFQAKLEAAVAEGKVAPDDPIVTDWHASKKLKADAQSFGQALDDKLAGPTVLPMSAEQALQTKAKNAVAEVKDGGLNLTMKQIPVFNHLQKAFAENRVDDVIGADGKWKYNEIGTALGLARGSVESFVNGVAKRIAEAQGVSVDEMKAALKARTAEVRTTEMSEKDKLGLSPKQQSSVFNEEDLFGNENGAEQNAEVINTVGGSQSAVGENVPPPDDKGVVTAEELDRAERVAAKAKSEAEAAVTAILASPHAAPAAGDFQSMFGDGTWGKLTRFEQAEFIDAYENALATYDTFDEAEAALVKEFSDYGQLAETDGTARIQDTSRPQEGVRERPDVPRIQGQAGSTGQDKAVPEGQPVSDEAAGRSDTEGQAGEVISLTPEQAQDRKASRRTEVHTTNDGLTYMTLRLPAGHTMALHIKDALAGRFGHLFNDLNGIYVTDEGTDDAFVYPRNGRYDLVFHQSTLDAGPEFQYVTLHHELAHVADDAAFTKTFSDNPVFDRVFAQIEQLWQRLPNTSILKMQLFYPLGDGTPVEDHKLEVFAQLWAATQFSKLDAELKKYAPLARGYIHEVQNAVANSANNGGKTSGQGTRRISSKNSRARQVLGGVQEGSGFERIQEVAGPTAARLSTDASTIIGRAAKWFVSLHDLIGKYGHMLNSADDWYKSVRATIATRTQLEGDAESIAARAGKLKPKVLEALNKFVADSTFEQKWGFNATFDKIDGTKRSVTTDPEMARRFNALPEDARQIAKDMFLHAEAVKLTKFKLLKELGLSGLFDTQGSLAGPYAPLKRFGNYVAVLKSKELLAAEEAGDKKRVEELKRDYKHYVVSYFDTKGLAKEFAQKEQTKSGWAYAQHFPKAQHIKETSETSQATLQKVLAAMKVEKDKLPPGAYAMIEEVILDMHMRKFDEDNARMNGLKRKNRYGYDEDMVRAFLSHARAEAGFLANLKHGGKTNELFYKMQFEAGKAKDRDAAMEVFNAISNHYAANIDQRETPIQDRITALTSVMQLATNPAYHLQNLTQPFITSVPRLAADFGDYSGAWKALMEGYRVVRSVGTKNIDLSKVQNLKLRAALQGASDAGLLDVGMDEDLINFEATRTGYAALDVASKGAKKVIHMLRQVSRRVEGANRISAAVAAFNMAQASGKFKDDAAINDYVISVLQDTQGDFSRTDAPLIIKKLPKPLVQYRKFQLMMAAHYVKAFNASFEKLDPAEIAKMTPAERQKAIEENQKIRAVGRRALAYSLGHAFATAGALGIPLMNIVGLIFAHTGDDDEPRDLERSLREWIGDEDMAKLLLHGPLWWMGMDAKLAQDKVFSFLPYADWDLTSKEGVKNLMWGMTGPAGSQALKMAGGLEYLSKGDTIKGFEGLLPSGISNGLKAFRVANEGFTLKNGDLMMSPDEINGAALMFDAVGLKSPTMRDLEWTRNQQYEIKEFYQTKTKEIQRAYADAYKDGDSDAMTEAREEWMALQEGKDRLRAVFNNSPDELKRQPLSTLLKYPRTQDKREQKLQKSVPE